MVSRRIAPVTGDALVAYYWFSMDATYLLDVAAAGAAAGQRVPSPATPGQGESRVEPLRLPARSPQTAAPRLPEVLDGAHERLLDLAWCSRIAKGYGVTARRTRRMLPWPTASTTSRRRGRSHRACQIDHLCRMPTCVNAEHLEAVTAGQNVQRGRKTKLTPDAGSRDQGLHREAKRSRPPLRDRPVPSVTNQARLVVAKSQRLKRSPTDLQATPG